MEKNRVIYSKKGNEFLKNIKMNMIKRIMILLLRIIIIF